MEQIFLQLSAVDVANVCIAIPHFKKIITTSSFQKKFMFKFDKVISFRPLNSFRAQRELHKYKKFDASLWCSDRFNLTPSGHCIACLCTPHLLTVKPQDCDCYCPDHRQIWKLNTIVWGNRTTRIGEWPVCGEPEHSSSLIIATKRRALEVEKNFSKVRRLWL